MLIRIYKRLNDILEVVICTEGGVELRLTEGDDYEIEDEYDDEGFELDEDELDFLLGDLEDDD